MFSYRQQQLQTFSCFNLLALIFNRKIYQSKSYKVPLVDAAVELRWLIPLFEKFGANIHLEGISYATLYYLARGSRPPRGHVVLPLICCFLLPKKFKRSWHYKICELLKSFLIEAYIYGYGYVYMCIFPPSGDLEQSIKKSVLVHSSLVELTEGDLISLKTEEPSKEYLNACVPFFMLQIYINPSLNLFGRASIIINILNQINAQRSTTVGMLIIILIF